MSSDDHKWTKTQIKAVLEGVSEELDHMTEELKSTGQHNDRLVIEVSELNEKIRIRDLMAVELNERISELEGENQNLLRRVNELSCSAFKLQQENEALKRRVEVAEELLLEEPPVVSTDKKVTATIEVWLVGHAADKLRMVWATEGYIRSIKWAVAKRVNEVHCTPDVWYFGPVEVTL